MNRDSGAEGLTERRIERKYLVPTSSLDHLVTGVQNHLVPHHHDSAASRLASMGRHYTTTVYFDTPSRDLHHAAVHEVEHVKLRTREYYDVLPLVELVTDPSDLLRHAPVLWLELKLRAGETSGKRRVGVPKHRVPQFLATGVVDEELLSIQRREYGTQGDRMLEEMLAFLRRFDEPLRASCIVNYRRTAWQDPQGQLRVTLDEELAAFAPLERMWSRQAPLTRELLGRPARLEPHAVLEVKYRGQPPGWLDPILAAAGAERRTYSKFVAASEAVWGR